MKKTWDKADIIELSIGSTENGGMPSTNFDQEWFDENGALHVNFVKDESSPNS